MTQDEEGVGIGFGKESYIQFYYNYDTHERAKQSSLLLSHLLEEKVSFLSIPLNNDIYPFPNIVIKAPGEKMASRYHNFELQNPETDKNFRNQCRIMKESALEKRTTSAGI